MDRSKEEKLKEFGVFLRHLRMKKGASLSEVGEAAGMSHNFLSELERGKKEPSDETLRALAKFYNIDEDELFKILERVYLRTKEYIVQDPELQKILSELQKKYKDEPDKIRSVKDKILRLYTELLEED